MTNTNTQQKESGANECFSPILENSANEQDLAIAFHKPMNIEELSIFISKPIATIYQFTSQKKIPHVKCGRDLLFFKEEIILWLKSNRVKTQEQLASEVKVNLSKS